MADPKPVQNDHFSESGGHMLVGRVTVSPQISLTRIVGQGKY